MGILNIDLNNINLKNNFDEDDPDTIILILIFQIFVYKQRTCLLSCLVLFTHQAFHQFKGSICLCICGDL